MKLTRVKRGVYRTQDDTVVKREGRRWAVYRTQFDFYSGRMTGVAPPRFFLTLGAARAYLAPLGPNRIASGCYSKEVNR